jgi:hypothetical protein
LLQRFSLHFRKEFDTRDKAFLESHARRIFLTFLNPAISDSGSYYIDSNTRTPTRSHVVIDLFGKKYVIELKITPYGKNGSDGIVWFADYLSKQGLDAGYFVLFSSQQSDTEKLQKDVQVNGRKISIFIA